MPWYRDLLLPITLITMEKRKKNTHTRPSASLVLIKVSKAALISLKCQGMFSKMAPSLETAPGRKALVCISMCSSLHFLSIKVFFKQVSTSGHWLITQPKGHSRPEYTKTARGLEQLWWLLAANLFCARLLLLVRVLFQEVQLWVLIQFTPFLSFHPGVCGLLNQSGKYECINLLTLCANLNINVPAMIFSRCSL